MSSELDIDDRLSPDTPGRLDARLRRAPRMFDFSWRLLESAIAEAKARDIHKDLGFKSWPDYIADVARTELPDVSRSVEQRRQVVALLAGEGMSQRAIADAVGVDHATVSRDEAAIDGEQVLHDAPPEPVHLDEQMLLDVAPEPTTVTGLDGKSYPKPKPHKPWQPKPSNEFSKRFYSHLSDVQHHAQLLKNLTTKKGFAENLNELWREHHVGIEWANDLIAEVQNIIAGVLAQMRDQGELFGDAEGAE